MNPETTPKAMSLQEEIDKLIDSIYINKGNFEYIVSNNHINGSLRYDLNRILKQFASSQIQQSAFNKQDLINLVDDLMKYTREGLVILGHEEREAVEFVDIFLEKRYPAPPIKESEATKL